MVTQYVLGGKPIQPNPQFTGMVGRLKQFPSFAEMALDSNGNIAVRDRAAARVQVFQPDSTLVKTISLANHVEGF